MPCLRSHYNFLVEVPPIQQMELCWRPPPVFILSYISSVGRLELPLYGESQWMKRLPLGGVHSSA